MFQDKFNGGLSIVGNTLYVEDYEPKLYALDARTGAVRWSSSLPNIAMNTPIVVNGIVIVGTGTSFTLYWGDLDSVFGRPAGDHIIAFDSSVGTKRWSFQTVGEDMPTGTLALAGYRPVFIFSNGDNHVYALDPTSGALIWKQPTPGMSTMSHLATYHGLVYGLTTHMTSPSYWKQHFGPAKDQQREVEKTRNTWAVDPLTGRFVWSNRFGTTDGAPALGDGTIFDESNLWAEIGSLQYNVIYAADAASGAIRWSYESPGGPQPLKGSDEQSIAGMYYSGVYYESLPSARAFAALDARNGKLLWMVPTHEAVKMSAVVKDGLVYVGDTGGYLYLIRASNGSLVRTIRFPDIFRTSPPVIVGDTFFVANGKSLYAIDLQKLYKGIIPLRK
jgi:outer membrane protein assembly factor BamB